MIEWLRCIFRGDDSDYDARGLRQKIGSECCEYSDGSGEVNSTKLTRLCRRFNARRLATSLMRSELSDLANLLKMLHRIQNRLAENKRGVPRTLEQVIAAAAQVGRIALAERGATAEDLRTLASAACYEYDDGSGDIYTSCINDLFAGLDPEVFRAAFSEAPPVKCACSTSYFAAQLGRQCRCAASDCSGEMHAPTVQTIFRGYRPARAFSRSDEEYESLVRSVGRLQEKLQQNGQACPGLDALEAALEGRNLPCPEPIPNLSTGGDARAGFANTPGKSKTTPTYSEVKQAVVRGNIGTVLELLRDGFDVNTRNEHGETMLLHALCMGDARLTIAELLVAQGADVNATVHGQTLLRFLRNPVYCDNERTLAFLVRQGAAEVDETNSADSPLPRTTKPDADAEMIRFECSAWKHRLKAALRDIGKWAKCKVCNHRIRVPEPMRDDKIQADKAGTASFSLQGSITELVRLVGGDGGFGNRALIEDIGK